MTEKNKKKTIQSGEEYLLKKQKSTPKKIAKILILLWILCIMTPVMYICLTKSVQIKEFVIVKGIYEANEVLIKQYQAFSNQVISKINISQYTSKIEIPEIKLDKINQTSEKVEKTANALSKLGLKGADKVSQTTTALQSQIDKVNQQIQDVTLKTKKILETDIQAALKKEVKTLADNQVQKQLNLSNSAYQAFADEKFGLMSADKRQMTSQIYAELAKGASGVFKDGISLIDKYFKFISWGISGLLFILMLIPILIVWWIAKKLSANFTECPYCGKVFLSKAGKLNLLKMFKS